MLFPMADWDSIAIPDSQSEWLLGLSSRSSLGLSVPLLSVGTENAESRLEAHITTLADLPLVVRHEFHHVKKSATTKKR